MQEVVLAREIVVLCGPTVISWDLMVALAMEINLSGWVHHLYLLTLPNGVRNATPVSEMQLLGAMRHVSLNGPDNSIDEYELLEFAKTVWNNLARQQATDPRDRIYAGLGIMKAFLPRDIDPLIRADYTKPSDEVFIEFSKAFITRERRLTFLGQVDNRSAQRRPALPSWVPDFSASNFKTPLDQAFPWTRYDAWPMSLIDPDKQPEFAGNALGIYGSVCDNVAAICAIHYESDTESAQNIFELLLFCTDLDALYGPTHQERSEAVARTLTADALFDLRGEGHENLSQQEGRVSPGSEYLPGASFSQERVSPRSVGLQGAIGHQGGGCRRNRGATSEKSPAKPKQGRPRTEFIVVTLCPRTFAAVFGRFCHRFLRHLHPGIPCSAHLLKGFDSVVSQQRCMA